jgi:hypothetical protein
MTEDWTAGGLTAFSMNPTETSSAALNCSGCARSSSTGGARNGSRLWGLPGRRGSTCEVSFRPPAYRPFLTPHLLTRCVARRRGAIVSGRRALWVISAMFQTGRSEGNITRLSVPPSGTRSSSIASFREVPLGRSDKCVILAQETECILVWPVPTPSGPDSWRAWRTQRKCQRLQQYLFGTRWEAAGAAAASPPRARPCGGSLEYRHKGSRARLQGSGGCRPFAAPRAPCPSKPTRSKTTERRASSSGGLNATGR